MIYLTIFREFKKHLGRRHAHWGLRTGILLATFSGLAGIQVYADPAQFRLASQQIDLDEPITVQFALPVTRTNIEPTIEPAIPGEWRYSNYLFRNHLPQTLTFYPLVNYSPATDYTIHIGRIRSNRTPPTNQTVRTIDAPTVSEVSPAPNTNLGPTPTLTITLSHTGEIGSRFHLTSHPETAWNLVEQTPTSFIYQPQDRLHQGTSYRLALDRMTVQEELASHTIIQEITEETIWSGMYTVPPPPHLTATSPNGSDVTPSAVLSLKFSEPINPVSLSFNDLRISPPVSGAWSWSAPETLQFMPDAGWALGTSYTITIPPGLRTTSDSPLVESIVHSFTTIGPVHVTSLSPGKGATGIPLDRSLVIRFNQNLVENQTITLAISPTVAGKTSWSGREITFTPQSSWAPNTLYSITIPAGIQGTMSPPAAETTTNFTTIYTTTEVATPLYYQEHNLSCEAAALRMALAAKGAYTSEQSIIDAVGFDPTPHNGSIWGDPDNAFVGDIDGKQMTEGYGVYWDPIARAGHLWRPTEAFIYGDLDRLLAEIDAGNPVVVWGYYGSGRQQIWQTPTGKTIVGITGEHARVVTGYIGPRANPTWILVNDPIAGKTRWRPSQFVANWQALNRGGVVVR